MSKKLIFTVLLLLGAGAIFAGRFVRLTCFSPRDINPAGNTIETRLTVPHGYERVAVADNSFAAYLRKFPLRPDGTKVNTYSGQLSPNNYYAAAVLDIPVGRRDLLQCADAVMRLRADYLYGQKKYDRISFNFVSGFRCDYASYMAGKRYANGKWQQTGKAGNTYAGFTSYLDLVYSYASTLSLEKELKPVKNIADLAAGDVFIRGGAPGHCFIVMDVVKHKTTGEKRFAIAQGFMPAQDVHMLKDMSGDVWLKAGEDYSFAYSELLTASYLRRFAE